MKISDDATPALTFEQVKQAELSNIASARRQAAIPEGALVGLALSGGGIRSATFCLGVLQAFAKKGKLVSVDYLSTVSGGGYIGSWLSAWIYRKGLSKVQDDLRANSGLPANLTEAIEVTWLRKYSNYLAPKLGLLSADSMTLVATWVRNVILNLVVVVSLLALVFLVPRLLLEPTSYAINNYTEEFQFAAMWFAFFVFPLAIALNLSRGMQRDEMRRVLWMNTTGGVFSAVIIPGLVISVLASIALFSPHAAASIQWSTLAIGACVLFALTGIVWLIYQVANKIKLGIIVSEATIYVLAYSVAIAIGFLLIRTFIHVLVPVEISDIERSAKVLTFGPPVILVTFGVIGSVMVGLIGRVYYERTREWWSRMNAWFVTVGVAWLLLFALSFYAPPLIAWANAKSGAWFSGIASVGWIGTLATALLTPKPDANKSFLSYLASRAINVVAILAVAGFFIVVACITWAALVAFTIGNSTEPERVATKTDVEFRVVSNAKQAEVTYQATDLKDIELGAYLIASFKDQESVARAAINFNQGAYEADATVVSAFACLLIFLLFGWRVDVNKFSLHNLYKNRLIRCYLGASRQEYRNAHPFTGFDEDDNLALAKLQKSGVPNRAGNAAESENQQLETVVRPLHIINSALNITQGENLAWQERKAASFTMSPLFCGFSLGRSTGDAEFSLVSGSNFSKEGYRDSEKWASKGGESRLFSLGVAMTTSGAALSSNQGKATTTAFAFLSTIFNVRLGRWSPNPIGDRWQLASPRFGLICLIQELFGYSRETSNFIHLSDGGHFDNTGVYELIRRQGHTIIAVDATADPSRGFEDLANMIRKCRIDFGVRIELSLEKLGTSRKEESASSGYSVGKIHYADGEIGTLFVIKPTLIALAKLDVDTFAYSRINETFPHQSTIDQFFSESQFESYRNLGEQIGTACLEDEACHLPSPATIGNKSGK